MQTLVSRVIRVRVWMGTCELCEAKGHMRQVLIFDKISIIEGLGVIVGRIGYSIIFDFLRDNIFVQ